MAVGDPALFEVEHSEREPQLLFVKVLTAYPAKTNVLISTAKGHQVSLLVVSKGGEASSAVDFLVNYQRERSFMIEPTARSMVVPETIPVAASQSADPAKPSWPPRYCRRAYSADRDWTWRLRRPRRCQ